MIHVQYTDDTLVYMYMSRQTTITGYSYQKLYNHEMEIPQNQEHRNSCNFQQYSYNIDYKLRNMHHIR